MLFRILIFFYSCYLYFICPGNVYGQESYDDRFNKALNYYQVGEFKEAIDEFKLCVKLKPESSDPYFYLARIYETQHNLIKAMDRYEKVIQLKADHFLAHKYLAGIYYKNNMIKDAIKSYGKAIEIRKDDYETHYFFGNVLFRVSLYKDAINEYREALRYNPEYAGAYNNIGFIYRSQGKLKGFGLKKSMDLIIYAIGEGSRGEMHDYGWIVDAKTHKKYGK